CTSVAAIAAEAVETARPSVRGVVGVVPHWSRQRVGWAEHNRDHLGRRGSGSAGDVVDLIGVIPAAIPVALFEIRTGFDPPVGAIGPAPTSHILGDRIPDREAAPGIVIVVQREGDLFKVILAGSAVGGLAHLLDGRY